MNKNKSNLDIVGDFLIRFYHEEPCETKAAIKAISSMKGLFNYELEISNAFREIFEESFESNTLKNLVKQKANRYVKDDEEAKKFLIRVFQDANLENAIDFDELKD
jgi:hypothetical protein